MQVTYYLTIVYAFNTREERRGLWEYLEGQNIVVGIPWMVLGDFNSVLNIEDRIGGVPVTLAEVIEFHNCVDSCGLLQFP